MSWWDFVICDGARCLRKMATKQSAARSRTRFCGIEAFIILMLSCTIRPSDSFKPPFYTQMMATREGFGEPLHCAVLERRNLTGGVHVRAPIIQQFCNAHSNLMLCPLPISNAQRIPNSNPNAMYKMMAHYSRTHALAHVLVWRSCINGRLSVIWASKHGNKVWADVLLH